MPGASFETPPIAELLGIALKDPTGPFPATRKDVQDSAEFDGSAVNEAKWVDIDGDEKPGLTMYLVPPGGIAAGGATGPLEEKTATSAKCPRNDAGAKRSPYAYLPLPEGLMIRRVKRMYAGQRLIMELRGKLDSCDRVSGEVTGPKGGKLELENKVGGCVTASGSDEAPCPASVVDLFDSMSGAKLSVQSGTFSMVRIDAAASCADVRAAKFE